VKESTRTGIELVGFCLSSAALVLAAVIILLRLVLKW
jgi:hypothetical protein